MRRAGRGATAGAVATVPMIAVMFAAQQLGLMGRQPPAKITDALLDSANVHPPAWQRHLWTAVAHFGFGAAAGALFASVLRRKRRKVRAALEGAAYATGVWAASYAGWVPEMGIMPRPTEDRPGRPLSMLVAHWVFGATLGLLVRRRR